MKTYYKTYTILYACLVVLETRECEGNKQNVYFVEMCECDAALPHFVENGRNQDGRLMSG